ncbi:hypothetical protein JI735_19640 [Paenibacillus sonchi]|uniref:Uncharacterized protein n=1 Tax=Paenibacillus sonchi TaxID=373687 RepID=A0A974P8X0_9BACL|nr:hypothetical protein [Paenibacillus sonchi]QQZ58943.1 hypothetical protein JI735_19640 [Paenibacillus sonchi]
MLKVTIDMYSGKPNPEFSITDKDAAERILKEIALNRGVITDADAPTQNQSGLGYRGINISLESDYLPQFFALPESFGLANGYSMLESKGIEIIEKLLHNFSNYSDGSESNFESKINKWVIGQMKNMSIKKFPSGNKSKPFELQDINQTCPYEKVNFEPNFWNNSEHIRKNNCYNFASNRRTDSFAQPGRGAGQMYNEITCNEVTRGAIADGCHRTDSCFSEEEIPRFFMALVIAPGPDFSDYHWYRQCSDGNWAHKPGQTAARLTDNSNRIITDPSVADRGPYTEFCGYMLSPKSLKIF